MKAWGEFFSTLARAIAVSFDMRSVANGVPSWSRWTSAPEPGGVRWADQPQAPASIASCSRRHISGRSASVASRSLAASRPIT